RLSDECIRIIAADALEEIVLRVVRRVELPVVTCGRIAAPAIERNIQFAKLNAAGECHAVNRRIDRMAISRSVDGDGDRVRVQSGGNEGDQEKDSGHHRCKSSSMNLDPSMGLKRYGGISTNPREP